MNSCDTMQIGTILSINPSPIWRLSLDIKRRGLLTSIRVSCNRPRRCTTEQVASSSA